MRQVYIWEAVYKDGKILRQFDGGGTEHLFKEVCQERLKEFAWVPVSKELSYVVPEHLESVPSLCAYRLSLREGDKLFACMRVHIAYSVSGPVPGGQHVEYLLGTEEGGRRSFLKIKEDGSAQSCEEIT